MQRQLATHSIIELPAIPPVPMTVDGLVGVFDSNPYPSARPGVQQEDNPPHTYLIFGHSKSAGGKALNPRSAQSRNCRNLMQQLLQRLHPEHAGTWSVVYEKNGAPRLRLDGLPSAYQVSFSHSQNRCAVAVSRQSHLAVDMECCGSGRDFAALGSYLSRYHGWQLPDAGEFSFLARWTLWEACAKLTDQSVLSEYNDIFSRLQNHAAIQKLSSSGDWHILQLEIEQQAFLSLVLKYPQSPAQSFRELDVSHVQAVESPAEPLCQQVASL